MDNKRMILAIALSIGVLVLWNFLFPSGSVKDAPPDSPKTGPAAPAPQPSPTASIPIPHLDAAPAPSLHGARLVVETPLYQAEINTTGGVLEHFVLKQYKTGIKPDAPAVDLITADSLGKAPLGLIWNQVPTWRQAAWSSQSQDLHLDGESSGQIIVTGVLGDLTFERRYTFKADTYGVEEQTILANNQSSQQSGTLSYTMASKVLAADDSKYNQTKVVYAAGNSLEEESDTEDLGTGIQSEAFVDWGGISSNYFLLSVLPQNGTSSFKGKFEDEIYRVALGRDLTLAPGQQVKLACTYYLGPKKADLLVKASPKLASAINYGWSDFIAKPLMQVLNFFYRYVGNYGVAIILLTILIKLVFWPLSQKSYKSMEKMKKLQPMMAKLREKYKDDRQKMNEELMGLYKTYKVNPAGGCLPMLLQIPVFIALYQGLMGAIELRHAPFIPHLPLTDLPWLADLSVKDPYYITPIVMGATMFLQQKMSPSPGDPMQAKLMLLMPVIFTFMFLSFPSGLVVYWLVNNVLSIAQQWWMMRKA